MNCLQVQPVDRPRKRPLVNMDQVVHRSVICTLKCPNAHTTGVQCTLYTHYRCLVYPIHTPQVSSVPSIGALWVSSVPLYTHYRCPVYPYTYTMYPIHTIGVQCTLYILYKVQCTLSFLQCGMWLASYHGEGNRPGSTFQTLSSVVVRGPPSHLVIGFEYKI